MRTTQDVRLRRAGPEDGPAVDALFRRSYPRLLAADYPPSVMVTAVPLLARAQARLLETGLYRVVEGAAGRLVAAGGWTPGGRLGAGGARVAEIRHLATDPDAVREGHARAIVEDCLAEACAARCGIAIAMATRTAVPFYAALGFEAVGEEMSVPLRPGIAFPAQRMSRRI